MTDNLDTLSDAELSEAFAVEVANIPHLYTLMKRGLYYRPNACGYTSRIEDAWKVTEEVANEHVYPHAEPVTKHRLPYPPFATSANAVLPWLRDYQWTAIHDTAPPWTRFQIVARRGRFTLSIDAASESFPRAAVIALIRAHRAQKSL